MSDDERRTWKGPKDDASKPRDARGRPMGARVRDKSKSPSSRAWIERQLNDPYVHRAQAEGWRARAAFKLIELDDRFHFIKKGARVVDLGAAPGGWSQAVMKRGAKAIVGIDLLPIEPLVGAAFLQKDFLDTDAPAEIEKLLGGKPDLILSDMAANTTGHHRTDQIKTGALAEAAVEFALRNLAPGGAFVTKAFQGGLDAALLARLKAAFDTVRHAKPPSSRAESSEIFVVARGFHGAAAKD
ncbi:MAG: RlmE family RNA methyltransferase [Hyphomonadaceae bacterium]